MRYLIDTHIFLWLIERPEALSATAVEVLTDKDSELLLSLASLWEIAIKVNIGKLRFEEPIEEFFIEQLRQSRIELLPIQFHHALKVRSLPLHHRDPFDRLIIAQALVESLPVISSDAAFDRYNLVRVW